MDTQLPRREAWSEPNATEEGGYSTVTRPSNSTRRADAMTSAAFGQPHLYRPPGQQQRQAVRQLSTSERRRRQAALMPCAQLARLVDPCCPTLNLSNSETCNIRLSRNQITSLIVRKMGSAGQVWLEDRGGLEYDAKCIPSIVLNKAPHFYPCKGIGPEVYQDCGIKLAWRDSLHEGGAGKGSQDTILETDQYGPRT